MKDIKKIQEFFSKPLEEISTDSIGMKQQYILTEPVQIAYTDSFGTGISKARGVLHQANAGYFIGEEDAYIIILPGGTFYVSEDGEVAMRIWPIRDQSDEFGAALAKTPFAPKYEDWKDSLRKAPVKEADLNDPVLMKMRAAKDKLAKMRKANAGGDGNDKFFDNAKKIAFLKKEREQLMRDMEQEAEPEGGSIADEYGRKLNKIDAAIAKLSGRKEMDYDTAVGKVDEAKVEFYQKGKKTFEKEFDTEEEANAYKAKAADIADASAVELKEYDVYMPSQEEVDQFFQDNITLGTHYLNRRPVMGQEGSFNKTEIAPWDETDYSNWKTLVAKALKEEEGYSKFLKTDDNPEGKTKGLDTKTMNKILMNVIKDLDELKQLGEGVIEEELCAKGKAYRKKRMAAGEKSSAYLSGRAVKVCKGDMKG